MAIRKDLELHQVFVYHFWYQMVLILSIYLLFAKIIEIFWSRDVIDIWVLAHFEPKIQKYLKIISSLHMPNCFKYFLIYILKYVSKNQARKILKYINSTYISFCAKTTRYSQRFLNYTKSLCIIFCGKIFQYLQIV